MIEVAKQRNVKNKGMIQSGVWNTGTLFSFISIYIVREKIWDIVRSFVGLHDQKIEDTCTWLNQTTSLVPVPLTTPRTVAFSLQNLGLVSSHIGCSIKQITKVFTIKI